MTTSQIQLRMLSDQATQHLLAKDGTREGNKAGWLMISTILIEAWNLYSIAFLMLFIKDSFHPTAWQLGAAAACAQAARSSAPSPVDGWPIGSAGAGCSSAPWCSSSSSHSPRAS